MKRFIQTIRNIYKIEDLRLRIINTIGFILIYRLGAYVVLPGIDPSQLSALEAQSKDGLLGLLNMFSGGAFSNASIFALGIMPYISASIVIQLLGMAVPYFQKLQKDGDSGRKKINQITRYLTVIITAGQAPAYLGNIISQLPNQAISPFDPGISSPTTFFWISSIIILVAGTMFVMWLGEKIQQTLPLDNPLLRVVQDEAMTANDIARKLHVPVDVIGAQLSTLLLMGSLTERGGKYYACQN